MEVIPIEKRETLKDIWQSQGLTAVATAKKAQVALQTLYNLNNGKRVSRASEARIWAALGIQREGEKRD